MSRVKRRPGITFEEEEEEGNENSSNNGSGKSPVSKSRKTVDGCNNDGVVSPGAPIPAGGRDNKEMSSSEALESELGTISDEEEDEVEADGDLSSKGDSENNRDNKDPEYDELATIMPRGYKIMRKMGYKPETDTTKKPVSLTPIQMITKRNDHQDSLQEYNLTKSIDEDEFRQWNSLIHNDKTLSARWHHLQKIAFHMTGDDKVYKPGQDPRDFNVLWRGYVIALNNACEKSRRRDETQDADASKQENVNVNDNDNDKKENSDDGKEKQGETNSEQADKIVHSDPELELFDEMSTSEKIMKLNVFLRSELHYCCYCGVRYENDQDLFKHCPGLRQEDHE